MEGSVPVYLPLSVPLCLQNGDRRRGGLKELAEGRQIFKHSDELLQSHSRISQHMFPVEFRYTPEYREFIERGFLECVTNLRQCIITRSIAGIS